MQVDVALQDDGPRKPNAFRNEQPATAFLAQGVDGFGECLGAECLTVTYGSVVFQVYFILGELRLIESLHLEGQVLEILFVLVLLGIG